MLDRIKTVFLKGLLALLPLALTVAIIGWAAVGTENLVGYLFRLILPGDYYVPGMGIAVLVVVVFAVGLVVDLYLMSTVWKVLDRGVQRIPVVKSLYGGIRDFTRYIAMARDADQVKRVVLIKLNQHQEVIGFVTNPSEIINNEEKLAVYIPLSFQIGGLTVYVSEDQVTELDMSPETAMKRVLTASVPSPSQTPNKR
ncbi:conserved hypothetical protein [gamma proteobacterium HTCC5015]|nr:conserved hypothetical protein [gamma proteobacterium HTCC5015]